MTITKRTRFAPSPTGYLHAGHFYAAQFARKMGEECVLRIEDLDKTRAKTEFSDAIIADCDSFGLKFDKIIPTIQERLPIYEGFLAKLQQKGLIYPCFCVKHKNTENIGTAPHNLPTILYDNQCRYLHDKQISEALLHNPNPVYRFNCQKALELLPQSHFEELSVGIIKSNPFLLGDQVLKNKFGQISYHLGVVVDDFIDEISLITRGDDLLNATGLQRIIGDALGLPSPKYAHHRLIRDNLGQRLSKHHLAKRLMS